MPCYSITTQTIALTKALPAVLKKALEDSGWNVTLANEVLLKASREGADLSWTVGKGIQIRSSRSIIQSLVTEVTKGYSKAAVTWAAQKAGWTVQQTNENQLTLRKR